MMSAIFRSFCALTEKGVHGNFVAVTGRQSSVSIERYMTLRNFSSLISSFHLTSRRPVDSAIYMFDDREKAIIHFLQGDLPLVARPFAVLAEKIGMSEEDLIEKVLSFKEQGILRRFGATLRHQKAGVKANVMVAWYVPEEKIHEAGRLMATFKEVSHCYQRRTQGQWRYNVFTMIHGKNQGECQAVAKTIAKKTGSEDYIFLVTRKEFKKTSPKYF